VEAAVMSVFRAVPLQRLAHQARRRAAHREALRVGQHQAVPHPVGRRVVLQEQRRVDRVALLERTRTAKRLPVPVLDRVIRIHQTLQLRRLIKVQRGRPCHYHQSAHRSDFPARYSRR
jgi:hypothetical protein